MESYQYAETVTTSIENMYFKTPRFYTPHQHKPIFPQSCKQGTLILLLKIKKWIHQL